MGAVGVCSPPYLFRAVDRLSKQKPEMFLPTRAHPGATRASEGLGWLSDQEALDLARRARDYEELALSRLYALFADRVFRFIYYRIPDRARAEELTSDVFLRLLEKIRDFRLAERDAATLFAGWVFTIARNLVIDETRREQGRALEPLPDEDAIEADQDWELHITRADLQAALARLTEEQQTVLVLRFEEGWTSAQIARVMNKTEMAIKALQRRGLASMARLLENRAARGLEGRGTSE